MQAPIRYLCAATSYHTGTAFATIPAAALLMIAGSAMISLIWKTALDFGFLGALALLLILGIIKATQFIGHPRFVVTSFAIGLTMLPTSLITLNWKAETTPAGGWGYGAYEVLGWAVFCVAYAISGFCYMLAAILAIGLKPRERKGLATRPHWMQ